MDKCIKCQAELQEGVKFCADCGHKVGDELETKETEKATVTSSEGQDMDQLMEMVNGLANSVKDIATSREELSKRFEDFSKKQTHLERKGAFAANTGTVHSDAKPGDSFTKAIEGAPKAYNVGGKTFSKDYVQEIQEKSDDIYILSSVLKCDPRELDSYESFKAEVDEFKKAMDSLTSGEGAEWIPTGFSSSLLNTVRLQGRVANLHNSFIMPTDPYVFPVEGADPYMYLVGQSIDETGAQATLSTPGTGNQTYASKKLGARVYFSAELQEDSIIPIMPHIKSKLSTAMAETLEYNIVNGDTAYAIDNLDQAGAAAGAGSALAAWNGYRKVAAGIGGMAIDANGLFATSGSSQGEYACRKLRAAFGKYGINTNELAWVTGAAGYMKFLQLPNIQTVDKYGPKAMVHTGEMAKYLGIPIVVTSGVREDLNASGVSGGASSGNTDSMILLVNTGQFLKADRRNYTVQSEKDIEKDRYKVVSHARHDFKCIRGTADPVVGYIHQL